MQDFVLVARWIAFAVVFISIVGLLVGGHSVATVEKTSSFIYLFIFVVILVHRFLCNTVDDVMKTYGRRLNACEAVIEY